MEGSTDLAILRSLAKILDHPVREHLERPFVHYVLNQPRKAQEHFYGIRETKPDLVGIAIFDRLDVCLPSDPNLVQNMWRQRELENYFCSKDVILYWVNATAESNSDGPLFAREWVETMSGIITELESALKTLNKPSPWEKDIKVTDDFLDPLLKRFLISSSFQISCRRPIIMCLQNLSLPKISSLKYRRC
ncbi:MAG TPA: hypothetical protein ENI94_04410 [Gammaproteobacteria bacterium]|nr:hypothetical protein [Gammaproteobacteria bacterium]